VNEPVDERRPATALMLAENRAVEIEVPIHAVGLSPAFRKLLRIAPRHDVAVPPIAGGECDLPQESVESQRMKLQSPPPARQG